MATQQYKIQQFVFINLQNAQNAKHTNNFIRNYLQHQEEEVQEVTVQPPQSSVLNIIESVFDYIKRQKDSINIKPVVSFSKVWHITFLVCIFHLFTYCAFYKVMNFSHLPKLLHIVFYQTFLRAVE